MSSLEERWIIEVLTVHLEVRIPEIAQPLTEDQLDWNWHHWKKIESLLRYPEPYYAKELTRIVLEINEAVNGTRERLYGDQRDFIIWERVFHDMESAAIGGAFVIERVPEKKLPKLRATAASARPEPKQPIAAQESPDEPKPADPPVTQEREFTVWVVDETGQGVANVPMVFRGAGTSKTVPTNSSGIAKHKAKAERIEVTFEDSASLDAKMQPIWRSRATTPASKYLQEATDIVAVVVRPAAIEGLGRELFQGTKVAAGAIKTITVRPAKKRAIFIEMFDTLFRNKSAVVLPEGEAPSSRPGEHEAFTSVGVIAAILRYNEEHLRKKLLVAGHADRAGGAINQPLSDQRALAVCALLTGDKSAFSSACKAYYSEVDLTQIFDWTHHHPDLGFKCKPSVMNRNPSEDNYQLFRDSFNEWVKNTPPGEYRGTPISPKARIYKPDIWDAVFDLYEYQLGKELGESRAGVANLRSLLVWVDPNIKSRGFGEAHPIDKNRPDNVRSKEDRRVEVLLFDLGEEPDLLGDPKGNTLYDGLTYERTSVIPLSNANYELLRIRLHDDQSKPMSNVRYEVTLPGASSCSDVSVDGWVIVRLYRPNPPTRVALRWGQLPNQTTYDYQHEIVVQLKAGDERQEVATKLHNLGYPSSSDAEYDAAVRVFQSDYQTQETGFSSTGSLPPNTRARLDRIYGSQCDASL
jgi:outer membrane protein OmpA-like peptidoglycan-associated protein